ncbi:hypothetical protein E2C01_072453 [Portunus trituberculatus]|uniref:Uncharacterized protein n=1 Tax=Portunus trituberculatus TaxID=210409 RepID=A0A5B7IB89_PORTR|nr:hypothetical protein [Portunus trituberculatus]
MWWVHGSEGGFYTSSRRSYARKAPPPFLHKLGHGHYFGPSRNSYPDGPSMGTMNGHYYRKRLWQECLSASLVRPFSRFTYPACGVSTTNAAAASSTASTLSTQKFSYQLL